MRTLHKPLLTPLGGFAFSFQRFIYPIESKLKAATCTASKGGARWGTVAVNSHGLWSMQLWINVSTRNQANAHRCLFDEAH
ncbi:hypothetical protein ACLKA7_007483 [Drosophila subpalustris]